MYCGVLNLVLWWGVSSNLVGGDFAGTRERINRAAGSFSLILPDPGG
jgi:hypothetical protein